VKQTYAEMDPTTAALEKEHEAVSWHALLYDYKWSNVVSVDHASRLYL